MKILCEILETGKQFIFEDKISLDDSLPYIFANSPHSLFLHRDMVTKTVYQDQTKGFILGSTIGIQHLAESPYFSAGFIENVHVGGLTIIYVAFRSTYNPFPEAILLV